MGRIVLPLMNQERKHFDIAYLLTTRTALALLPTRIAIQRKSWKGKSIATYTLSFFAVSLRSLQQKDRLIFPLQIAPHYSPHFHPHQTSLPTSPLVLLLLRSQPWDLQQIQQPTSLPLVPVQKSRVKCRPSLRALHRLQTNLR